jgi:hypothetical protein
MDDASSHKRKAKQMYEPRPRALYLHESGEQQGEGDIFGEVRMNPHFAFQMNVASGADATFALRRACITRADNTM